MQALFWHTCTSVADPSQSFPLYCAGSKVLILDWVPLPHVTEQSLHNDQSFHLQSTNDNSTVLITLCSTLECANLDSDGCYIPLFHDYHLCSLHHHA